MYEFNSCGVCTNPDVIRINKMSYIAIAEVDDMYTFGFMLDFHDAGMASPCCTSGRRFVVREQCVNEAFARCIQETEHKMKWFENANLSLYKKSLEASRLLIQTLKTKQRERQMPRELSLFE